MSSNQKPKPASPEPQASLSSREFRWTRRDFLRTSFGTAAGMLALPALFTRAEAEAAGAPFDFTFYQMGDTHYLGFDTTIKDGVTVNTVNRTNIEKMGALTPSTPMPVAGTIGTPVGIINVGDLVNAETESDPANPGGPRVGGKTLLEKQWAYYIEDFASLGAMPGSLAGLPVYESYGNHDQDGFLKEVSDRIAARSALIPGITGRSGTFTYAGAYGNITVLGVHYAWKWGPVHFVQANIRSGDGMERMPSSGSYTFLKNYLENTVGTSGDPVMVIVHYPPDSGDNNEWPTADKQAFYDLLIRFNVIGILCGHTHSFGSYTWKGPGNAGAISLPVYRSNCFFRVNPTDGFVNVFRITNDPNDPAKGKLVMAQRLINDSWGNVTTASFDLSSDPPVGALQVTGWRSLCLHHGVARGLPIHDDSFVEPRQAGVREVEIQFDEAIVVPDLALAVGITGVTAAGPISSLASLGITANVEIGSGGDSLVLTFYNGSGPIALPDAAKWRFTLNPSAITGASDSVLSVSAATTRVISALIGDIDGNGRVNGIDLNAISNVPAFDSSITDCLRADINGDGQIGPADIDATWANRGNRIDTLATP
jgi:cytolysin (calcineurin-like family phosphatase)